MSVTYTTEHLQAWLDEDRDRSCEISGGAGGWLCDLDGPGVEYRGHGRTVLEAIQDALEQTEDES